MMAHCVAAKHNIILKKKTVCPYIFFSVAGVPFDVCGPSYYCAPLGAWALALKPPCLVYKKQNKTGIV